MLRHLPTFAAGAAFGVSTLLAQQSSLPPAKEPAAKTATNSKLELTPDNFSRLHGLIRPHDNEWRHLNVEWLTDVVAARKKAAAEDKPIVICYTGGAGYNEPLGVC